ncbi:hypothetical protein V8F33_011115 [Rhypophila sp. PSN 637]
MLDYMIKLVDTEAFEENPVYCELLEITLEELQDRFASTGLQDALHRAINGSHWALIQAICRVPNRLETVLALILEAIPNGGPCRFRQEERQNRYPSIISLMEAIGKDCFRQEEEKKALSAAISTLVQTMRDEKMSEEAHKSVLTNIFATLEGFKGNWHRPAKQKEQIADAIALVDHFSTRRNCLHNAIDKGAPLDVLDALVQYANEKALEQERDNGNTPLHDLVEFREFKMGSIMMFCTCGCGSCSKDSSTTVGFGNRLSRQRQYTNDFKRTMIRLIEGYGASLFAMNKLGQTPYVLHRESRSRVLAGNAEDWTDIEYEDAPDSETDLQEHGRNPKSPLFIGSNPIPLASASEAPVIDKMKLESGLGRPPPPESQAKKDIALRKKNRPVIPNTPALHKTRNGWVYFKYFVRQISMELLERCSFESSWNNAVTSLFGQSKSGDQTARQTSFVIEGALYEDITDYYEFLTLNPILKWVEVKLGNQPVATKPATDAMSTFIPIGGSTTENTQELIRMTPQASRSLNVDCLNSVLTWLRNKGVKRILKLVVRDDQDWQCSDDTIQSCLKDWSIRYLDWNKLDLSIALIRDAEETEVVELWLNWSGNNTALLGWADSDHGLRAVLPRLRQVHINITSSTEPVSRMTNNLERFKKLLAARFQDLKFETPTNIRALASGGHHNIKAGSTDKHKHDHRWFTAVEHFRQEAMMPSFCQLQKGSSVYEYFGRNPIKVALIDDGVTPDHLNFTDSVREGWPLDVVDEDSTISTYYKSREGHGTAMANLIHHVCPFAQFYVAKLEKKAPKPYKSVAHMAAEAVNWAVSKNVDVISMSWSIKASDAISGDEDNLNKAVVAAGQQGIILFCSFNDRGTYHGEARLPSDNDKYLRRVGSCNSDGKESSFVERSKVDYLLLGEQFQSYIKTEDDTDKGSSAATALASGLAAAILWCVERVNNDKEERRAWANAMFAVFDKLRTDTPEKKGSLVDVSAVMEAARSSVEGASNIIAHFVQLLRDKFNEEE